MAKRLSDDLQKEIVNTYCKTFSVLEVTKALNVSLSTVYKTLMKNGIDRKPISISKDKHKNSLCFTDFSKEPDSYFYGLLLSDGNLSPSDKNINKIQIELHKQDENILLEFKNFIKTENKLHNRKVELSSTIGEYSYIGFSSYTIYNRLIDLGLLPRKSGKEKLPNFDWLNNRDFWRGVVDGDGSLLYCGGNPKLKLIGSLELLEGFNSFCWTHCFTQKRKIDKVKGSEGVYTLSFNGEEAMYISKVLYVDSTLYLERKYRIAKDFSNFYDSRFCSKKGISYSKKYRNYKVGITTLKTKLYLGSFKDYNQALTVRINAEVDYYGKNYGGSKWHSVIFQPLNWNSD